MPRPIKMLDMKSAQAYLARYYELWNKPGPHEKTMGFPMLPEEAMTLMSLAILEQPDIIFESGTAVGWSSAWMALSGTSVHTFDPIVRERLFSHPLVTSYVAPFETTAASYLLAYKGMKKMILIDGLHTVGGCQRDFDSIKDLLEPGDFVIFHDTISERPVAKVFHRVQLKFPDWDYRHIHTRNGMGVATCR